MWYGFICFSLGSACSHVAALLIKLTMAVQLDLNKVACTSKLCEWKSCKRQVECLPLSEVNFKRPKKGALPQVASQTASSLPQHVSYDDPTVGISVDHLKELYKLSPDCAVFTSIESELVSEIENKLPDEDSSTDTASESEELGQTLPEPLTSLFDPTAMHTSSDSEIRENSKKEFENLTMSYTQSHYDYLTAVTVKQSQCPVWDLHRAGRITASRAHAALNLRENVSHKTFLENVMQYKPPVCVPAMKWGKEMEPVARIEYEKQVKPKHNGFRLELTGLVVRAEEPHFAASPDGIVCCQCHSTGLLEIKCPYKYRNGLPAECYMHDDAFPIDSNRQMKQSHPYYSQMQAQMMVCDVGYCDLFIWTAGKKEDDTFLIRVVRNETFITSLRSKMSRVFFDVVLPEVFTRRMDPREQDPTIVRYCDCDRPEFGRMLACQSDNCKHKWYHYSCIGITRAPQKKWICHNCKRL
jgi:hypothetical protein